MNNLLKRTIVTGIAVLASTYLTFGNFTSRAEEPSTSKPKVEDTITIAPDLENVIKIDPKAQEFLDSVKIPIDPEMQIEEESGTIGSTLAIDSETQKSPENVAVIDQETQKEYNLLQEYFKLKGFAKYEAKFDKIEAFKKLATLQEALNRTFRTTKDEKAREGASRKVVAQEEYIDKRFGMNRKHTGIQGILEDLAKLEKDAIPDSGPTEHIEGSEEQKAFNLAQGYIKYRQLKGFDDKQEKLKAFKELAALQRALNRAKDYERVKELTEDVFEKEKEINERFGMDRSHTGIKGIKKDIVKIEKGLDTGVSKDLKRVKKALKKKEVIASFFDCYSQGKPLTLEKYSEIMKTVRKNNFKGGMFERFVRLEKVLEYEDYIDKIAKKFEIDKKEMLENWNQESEFAIWKLGGKEERGLSQFRSRTAELIARGLRRNSDFKKLDYSFEKLSSNYELNIVMAAAQLASASKTFNYRLKRARLTFDQFYELIKEKGKTCTFSKIKAAKEDPEAFNLDPEWGNILKYYGVASDNDKRREKRIRSVQRVYRDKDGLLKDAIKYIVHNGGGYAVNNIRKDSFLSELLLYHLAVYVNNLKPLYKAVNAHYGDLFNIVQKNRDTIDRLEVGNDINLWGVNVSKHNIKQLQEYIDVGLPNKPLDERLKGDKIIVIADNHLLDEDMNVKGKLDAYHDLVLDSFDKVGKEYEKLKEFKGLETLQGKLNDFYKDGKRKDVRKTSAKVKKKEAEINKKFNMDRKHTGIKGIRAYITQIEEKITNYGFKPDLEAYEKTKGFDPLSIFR